MKKIALFSCAIALLSTLQAYACTDVQLTAKDGTKLIARSMEFGMDFKSNIRTSLRARQYTTTAPNGKSAYAWKATYGYVYLDGLNQDISFDGMNEQGLAFEYLYLPGETAYQIIPEGKESQAIPYFLLGDWILSSFKTVDEVKAALPNMFVYAQLMPGLGNMVLPGHAAIHDASGKGIVVEFIKGQMRIYDFMGIMTNSPAYPWQVTNLRNYLNLSPYSPNPITVNGMTYAATGQGAGMLGLPGDVSPPSRFVKTAFLAKYAYQTDNAMQVINLAQHILNNVDIPNGIARSKQGNTVSTDTTQWVVFKDLTHKNLYYRTYGDMTLRTVSLSKLNFAENGVKLKMPIASPGFVRDVTSTFVHSQG